MSMLLEKIELAKRLLDTEDQHVIDAVKSVFKNYDSEDMWNDMPDKVIADVEESIRQIDAGKGVPHEKAKETYQKWL